MDENQNYNAIWVQAFFRGQWLNEFYFVYPRSADKAEVATFISQTLHAEKFPEQEYELEIHLEHEGKPVEGKGFIEVLKVKIPNDGNSVWEQLYRVGYLALRSRYPELFDCVRLKTERLAAKGSVSERYIAALANATHYLGSLESSD